MKSSLLHAWCMSIFISSCTFSALIEASPLFYTLEGSILSISDQNNIIASEGYSVGDSFTIVLMADEALGGSATRNDGGVVPIANSIFINYIGGSAIPVINGGTQNAPNNIAENNLGFVNGGAFFGRMLSSNNRLEIDEAGGPNASSELGGLPSNWHFSGGPFITTTDFSFMQTLKEPSIPGSSVSISGEVTMTNVTSVNPIPVPAAVWLFGSALGLLGWMRRQLA